MIWMIIGICVLFFFNYYHLYQSNMRLSKYIEETIQLYIKKVDLFIDQNQVLFAQSITQGKLRYEELEILIYNHEEINRILNNIMVSVEMIQSEEYVKEIKQQHQIFGWKDTQDTFRDIRKKFDSERNALILNENAIQALSIVQDYYHQCKQVLANLMSKFD